MSPKSLLIQTNQIHSIIIFSHLDHQLIHRHILHFVTFRHFVLLLSFLAQKKCTPCLISWTYADKLHTFSLHYKITKTSSKTGFTQFCYSFRSHYIFLFGKSQIIFLSFYTHPISHHICNFQRKPSYDCVKWSYYTYY